MMPVEMYCPACKGRVVSCVALSRDDRRPVVRVIHAVCCLNCNLVSEVSLNGHLADLGDLVIDDLMEPVGEDEGGPPIMMMTPAPHSKWRDS